MHMHQLRIGDSYILPRDLHIESRHIRTLQGKKGRNDRIVRVGTEVAITSMDGSNGHVWFTDGTYKYLTTLAKLSGCLRYLHLGYDFFLQNGECTVRDLMEQQTVDTFKVETNIDLASFRNRCEERATGYSRPLKV